MALRIYIFLASAIAVGSARFHFAAQTFIEENTTASNVEVDTVAQRLSQPKASGWGVGALIGALAFLGPAEATISNIAGPGLAVQMQNFDTAEFGPISRAEAVRLTRNTIYELGDAVVEIAAASTLPSAVGLAGLKAARGLADREHGGVAQSAVNVAKEFLDNADQDGWANLIGTLNVEGGVEAAQGEASRKTFLLGQIKNVGELFAENLENVAGSAAKLGDIKKLGTLGKVGGRLGKFVQHIPHLTFADEALKISGPTVNFLKILKQDPTLIRTVLKEDAENIAKQSVKMAGAIGSFIQGVRPLKRLKGDQIGLNNFRTA